jgi:hypothetical protein
MKSLWQLCPGTLRCYRFRPRVEWLEHRLAPANDTLATALPLTITNQALLAAQAAGTLDVPNQVDLYQVQLNAGDEVTAEVVGNPANFFPLTDSGLRILDSSGQPLAATGTRQGYDARLTFTAPLTGVYYVGVSSANDFGYDPQVSNSGSGGISAGDYTLNLSRFLFTESEANAGVTGLNDTPATADAINANANVRGALGINDRDYFQFTVATTGQLTASVTGADGTVLLPRLTLYDQTQTGQQLLIQADGTNAAQPTAQLVQHLQPGTYYVAVSAVSNQPVGNHSYVLATTFASALPAFQPVPVGSVPSAVGVADFNGDGHFDMVTANRDPNVDTVSVSLGIGDGTFQPAVTYSVGQGPCAVVVGDFNGDGNLDIATANSGDNTISLLLGNGDGAFQAGGTFPASNFPGSPSSMVVGDFNGDHIPDLAVTEDVQTVTLGGTVTGGTFTLTVENLPPVTLPSNATADDVQTALVNALQTDPRNVTVTGNPGAYQIAFQIALGGANAPPITADGSLLTGTSPSITVDTTGFVNVLLGRGDGTFLPPVSYAVGHQPLSVVTGDFDGNGTLDLAEANFYDDTVTVLSGRGDGTFHQPAGSPYGVGQGPISLVVGGFFSDGHLDLVAANSDFNPTDQLFDNRGSLSVLRGRGDGTFAEAGTVAGDIPSPSFNGVTFVGAADFNHDGKSDLVITDENPNEVSVLLGQGNGTFAPAVAYGVGSNPVAIGIGDLDGDGNLDLLVVNASGFNVSVLLGRGDGTFLTDPTVGVGAGPVSVAVGDLNHDGNLDLVTANAFSNTASVLLGRGDGAFQPAVSYDVGNMPFSVQLAQLTPDGNLDIIVANEISSTVSILLGRGDGTFLPAQSFPVGVAPVSVAVGDVNGDGIPDLVSANEGDSSTPGSVSVLLGNGDGTFRPDPLDPTLSDGGGTTPVSVAVGYFDGDKNLDLAVANQGTDTVSIWLGNGDGSFQLAPGAPLTVPNTPSFVAVGNFDNQGMRDLAVATWDGGFSEPADDGQVSVFLGNGDGTFHQPAGSPYGVGLNPTSLAVGDFFSDGRLDLVAANVYSNTLSVLQGNVDGTFSAVNPLVPPAGSFPFGLAVGDFNGDGRTDLVDTNSGINTLSVWLYQGNGSFQATTPANSIASLNVPYLQDLTGDGIPDTLILDSSGDILFRQGLTGSANEFAPPVTMNPGHPARDFTVYRTVHGWAVAAADSVGNAVSLYPWDAATHSFQRTVGFATGNLPVRIAAADLNGDGLDDLVVANDFDNTVSIAFQTASGSFSALLTRSIGAGPSDISFANLGGGNDPDIVVSGQVSGDFSVLFNDASHSFSQQARYRAGTGLFDIDPSTATPTVLSQLQTVGVAADDFTGSGRDDLVVVNRGNRSFTLLPNLGQGRFAGPQPGNTYATSAQPSQVVSLTLPGDRLPSVAILMEDLGQIWLYHNRGNGTFAPPAIIDAGNAPNGLAVATVHGRQLRAGSFEPAKRSAGRRDHRRHRTAICRGGEPGRGPGQAVLPRPRHQPLWRGRPRQWHHAVAVVSSRRRAEFQSPWRPQSLSGRGQQSEQRCAALPLRSQHGTIQPGGKPAGRLQPCVHHRGRYQRRWYPRLARRQPGIQRCFRAARLHDERGGLDGDARSAPGFRRQRSPCGGRAQCR